jgi:hypothetical protein
MTELPRNHNNPPPEVPAGEPPPATFILKRATGEIEIRGRTPDFLTHAQLNHPEYKFDEHKQLHDRLWAVTGMKV